MKEFLQRIPLAAGCVGLGLVGLGTLLRSSGIALLWIFLAASLLFLLPVAAKLLLPGGWQEVCSDYTSLGTLAGSPMAWMLLSAQLRTEAHQSWAVWLWIAALAWHLIILGVFSLKLIRDRKSVV